MVLEIGAQLGPYEILSPVGAGGMGEVYRARDRRLDRIVAIKVIRYEFADDPLLRERLVREARAAATLTHPHVCNLHDVGREGEVDYLVFEYVQGETLASRLNRGPLPTNEALSLAIQLADALDAAHRQGVVHRDLKPANIMLTGAGAKLLDFGLARLRDAVAFAARGSVTATTEERLTAQGTFLGTLNYVAPEQLQGHEADARADIFAFGAVLYEALTARRAFDGSSPASIIAAILEKQPLPISTSRPLVPPALEHLVHRCLVKDVDNRWQSARDLFHELTWIQRALEGQPGDVTLGSGGIAASRPPTRWLWLVPWAIAALAAVVAATTLWFSNLTTRSSADPVRRLAIELPDGERLALARTTPAGLSRVALAISPDGTTVVYAGRRLYVRRLDEFTARELPHTDGAYAPVFSPDGRWIAFVSGDRLRKVALSGGDPLVLCEVQDAMALGWGERGIVLLDQFTQRLAVANPEGGTPRTIGMGGNTVGLLPGGDAVLVAGGLTNNPDRSVIEIVSLETGQRTPLPVFGVQPRYMAGGFLTFGRGGTLFAVPFDVRSRQVVGQEIAVEHGVRMEVPATAQYVISADGTLAYVPGGVGWNSQLVWVDPRGGEIPIGLPIQPYGSFRISPDGRLLAFVQGGATDDIWILDLEGGTSRRVTFQGSNSYPVWTPDGARVVFRRVSDGGESLWWSAVGEGGSEERLTADSPEDKRPYSVSPNGSLLAYASRDDILFLELSGTHAIHPILNTPRAENMPMFSPNGRALAYTTNESGRVEVYIRQLSGATSSRISIDGGEEPVWSPDGRRLFYRNGDRWMVSELAGVSRASAPTLVVQGPYLNVPGLSYGVGRDGRLLLLRGIEGLVDASTIYVVSNFAGVVRQSRR